jgi:hypothetical protein
MKKFIVKILKGNALGRMMYPFLHWMYRLYSVPRRRYLLHKRGPEVLSKIVEIFKKNGIFAYATSGTLLGVVRDHKFISSDDDLDFGFLSDRICARDVLKIFIENGFSYMFGWKYQGELTVFKLSYNSVPIDFYAYMPYEDRRIAHSPYWNEKENYPDTTANSLLGVRYPQITDVTFVEVYGVQVPVPANYDEVLITNYGKGWKVPDPNWTPSDIEQPLKMPEFAYAVPLDDALR